MANTSFAAKYSSSDFVVLGVQNVGSRVSRDLATEISVFEFRPSWLWLVDVPLKLNIFIEFIVFLVKLYVRNVEVLHT